MKQENETNLLIPLQPLWITDYRYCGVHFYLDTVSMLAIHLTVENAVSLKIR